MAFTETRTRIRQSLQQFLESDRDVQILYSTSTAMLDRATRLPLTRSLYVLDSSFNPPSLAHLHMARSAILDDIEKQGTSERAKEPRRLLFLLATMNADKGSEIDTFGDRLLLMQSCAEEMWKAMKGDGETAATPPIDVGVTKQAFFHDKAAAIDAEKLYEGGPEQIHLTGFDTFVRIFNTKYYETDHTLRCLEPMFEKHRLRVTLRTDDVWGDREAQERYIQDIADGKRDGEGAKREWADKIHLVEGKKAEEKPISSTRARKAASEKDWEKLKSLVPSSVLEVIQAESLYSAS